MTERYVLFDGAKSADIIPTGYLWDNGWNWLGNGTAPLSPQVRRRYETVGLLYSCVHIRAKSLKKVPWSIVDESGKSLWKRGDPPPDKFKFLKDLPRLLYKTEAALVLGSQAYIHKEKNRAGITNLRWLAPALVEPYWQEDVGVLYFDHKVGARNDRLTVDEVCYIWYQHPLFETLRDASPAEAAMLSVNVLYNVDLFTTGFFERGAIKAMILGVSGNPRKDEMDRIKSWWSRSVNGIRNAFKTEVVNADLIKPVVVGEGLAELTNIDLTTEKRNDIAISLGIPLSMMFSDAANYATAGQDEKNYYNNTIVPDCEIISEQMNEQILEDIGCHLTFQPGEMEIFQTDESSRIQSFSTLVSAGIKRSIAVQMVGLDLPDGVQPEDLDQDAEEAAAAQQEQAQGQGPQGEGQASENNSGSRSSGSRRPPGTTPADDEEPGSRRAVEIKQFKAWARKRNNPDPRKFESEILTLDDRLEILGEMKGRTKLVELDATVLLAEIEELEKGGPGSGNWAHGGRVGHEGGSTSGGGHGALLARHGVTARETSNEITINPEGSGKPGITTVKIDFQKNYVELAKSHPDLEGLEERRNNAGAMRDKAGYGTAVSNPVERSFPIVKERIDDCPVCIAVSPAAMMGIAEGGRFKTQFETGKSGGVNDTKYRADIEEKWMAAPKGMSAEERPIYGFIETSKIPGGVDGVEQYGKVIVKLKEDVRNRVTITGGDSLGTGLVPAPLQGIDGHNGLDINASRYSIRDPAKRTSEWGQDDPAFHPKNNVDWAMSNTFDYVEAQVWGGVKVSDIDVVYDPQRQLSGSKVKQLQAQGINVVQSKTPRNVRKENEAIESQVYANLRAQYPGQIISRKLGPDAAAQLDSIQTLQKANHAEILSQRQAEMGEMGR